MDKTNMTIIVRKMHPNSIKYMIRNNTLKYEVHYPVTKDEFDMWLYNIYKFGSIVRPRQQKYYG